MPVAYMHAIPRGVEWGEWGLGKGQEHCSSVPLIPIRTKMIAAASSLALSASAFVPASSICTRSGMRTQHVATMQEAAAVAPPPEPPLPLIKCARATLPDPLRARHHPRPAARASAPACSNPDPGLARRKMMVGDKTLAGDMGFDPLGIADTPDSLAWYREAEVKHARLAMLAAFGWPASEVANFGHLLTGDGRAPSLLNGGLENVSGFYWAAVVALGIYAEAKGVDKQFGKKDSGYLPGMLGFDPLGADSPGMRAAEITNGRVAMLAITAYALEEALTRQAIFPLNLFGF